MDNLKRRHISQPVFSSGQQEQTYSPGSAHTLSIQQDHDAAYKEKTYRAPPPPQRIVYSSNKYIAFCQQYQDLLIPAVLTLLAFWTRFRIIGLSNQVVWDEAHFGKFGSYYIKHEFYFDVHPPLGKMLVGLSGWLAGYDGNFGFDSGQTYPEGLNYTVMRIFNAFWGALMVPIAYATAMQLHMSLKASILAATMVLLDTAYLCISRFILLDSMLLFFTCTSLYCLASFHNLRNRPFTDEWWLWLALTGFSLGCVSSVKWVGLFAVALVGLYTIEDLWDMLGDLQMPKKTYLNHWLARIGCLIVIPVIVYLISFALHFAILYRSGTGDAQMSSLFQANLAGNTLGDSPLEIAYGSKLTFKNYGYGGGLLHSHVQTYPEGSKQQQVTCYHYKDDNNHWYIRTPRGSREEEYEEAPSIRFVQDGDIVRLQHVPTGRNLHSHPINAPITTGQWEVSAYGNDTIGDTQDNWQVEIVDDMVHSDKERVRSLTTRFRLRHVNLGCLLTANNVILPQWGFKQVEVYCDKRNRTDDPHSWWNVEEHWNDALPAAPKNAYKSKFLQDFWHLNVAMWTSNNALIPDPDKEDILSSEPAEWPMASVGLRMCGWGDDQVKFYLLGSPAVWWPAFASILLFIAVAGYYIIRMQRKIYDLSNAQWDRFFFVGKTLFLGWFLHYIPFFIMGRVTYLHHYFPALYFSILMVPFLLDHVTSTLSKRKRWIIFGVMYVAVIVVFIYFSPVAYGMPGPVSQYAGRRWLKSWNLID
ncbi:Dolichyl-phosphate-mannose-protein mannosyltransferase-domain-containing protein [Radiomyces spectabilis]|uniref:Dolichyl-phosphate-mannose-protein mannosyltransferase-domain-containing protein n=1 Tax=Radiomyces spectabilis TaxID=64574 RepID=UPI0022210C35|nr:Dolichyl-phosphate-mannose-protein mannosyltransferase-domain-containing protein [Radiomyces spectabilis]KAI8372721.1 Dolichyl-phosphate-mannose-protein mannosyltransferase-domain-containing protein [Radiomyces spectabilis]